MLKKLLCCTLAASLMMGAPLAANTQSFADTGDTYSTYNLSMPNDDQLIEMMIKTGKVSKDASSAEINQALKGYLKQVAAPFQKDDGQLAGKSKKRNNNQMDKMFNNGMLNGKGNKLGQTKEFVAPVELEAWNGEARKDNVLAILIDFPDFKHNTITNEETDMYYDDYTKEHYAEMLFADNGYVGPNGENFVSMKQYYEEQSGGSYSVTGEVAGWYTASKPARYYGNNDNGQGGRELVREALLAATNDPNVDLSKYDVEDRYDLDGDGNFREPDGLIDHIMIFHASVGEEAGGGQLGDDAIWSHRWNLGGIFTLPGTEAEAPYWDGQLAAYDYTIQPEDGAAGVCAHEYGHDLGLPDEYDTQYTGNGEPVSMWSIMSSGSWAGAIGGTEPTGFSPWCKEFFQANMGGNWQTGSTIDLAEFNGSTEALLDQANSKGTNNDVIKIALPDKSTLITTPASGSFAYFGRKENEMNNTMFTKNTITATANTTVDFKTWYQIEADWDYAAVLVEVDGTVETVENAMTVTTNPNGNNPGNGITGFSDGWVDASFDLSKYAGKEIKVGFQYKTDEGYTDPGFYLDDIKVVVDGNVVVSDDVEGETAFDINGFVKDTGSTASKHYYLVEWRNHQGVDAGLGRIKRNEGFMSFDPGMVVWYADEAFDNNHTGTHPGEGFIGVVDADQSINKWTDGEAGSTRYQIHDAAFSLVKTEKMFLDYKNVFGETMKDYKCKVNPLFDDSASFWNPESPDASKKLPQYGLKIRVTGESADRSVGKILITK